MSNANVQLRTTFTNAEGRTIKVTPSQRRQIERLALKAITEIRTSSLDYTGVYLNVYVLQHATNTVSFSIGVRPVNEDDEKAVVTRWCAPYTVGSMSARGSIKRLSYWHGNAERKSTEPNKHLHFGF